MAVATYEDVAVELGRPISTPEEQAQVTWWLNGVELIIAAELGDVSLLDQDALKLVEVAVVSGKIRALGESSVTISVDDGSVTRRFEGSVSKGDITDEWWDLLTGVTVRRGRVKTGWLLR